MHQCSTEIKVIVVSGMKKLPQPSVAIDVKLLKPSVESIVKLPEASNKMVDLTTNSVSLSVNSEDEDSCDEDIEKIQEEKDILLSIVSPSRKHHYNLCDSSEDEFNDKKQEVFFKLLGGL